MSGTARQKTRILLVDDQHVVREGIRRILESEADFEVVGETDNGQQAVRMVRELKPDLIIMEARLPKLDSPETIRRIKDEHPETAVLILTWRKEEEDVVELLRANVGGYLMKR